MKTTTAPATGSHPFIDNPNRPLARRPVPRAVHNRTGHREAEPVLGPRGSQAHPGQHVIHQGPVAVGQILDGARAHRSVSTASGQSSGNHQALASWPAAWSALIHFD